MRIKGKGLCITLACVMVLTIGPVGDYRSKIKAEESVDKIIDVEDMKCIPKISILTEEDSFVLTEESSIEGIKFEGNVLTLDGFDGGTICIENDESKIADLDIIVNNGSDSSISGLTSKRTNITLSGKGKLSIDNKFEVYDGDLSIEGPKVYINDSKEGLRLISTKPEESIEPETEESTEETTEIETEKSTEVATEIETEESTGEVTESELEEGTEKITESETDEETESSIEDETESSTDEVKQEGTDLVIEGYLLDNEDVVEYSDCKFTMISGDLIINMIPDKEQDRECLVYTHGIYANKVFLDGGTIKVEYKDQKGELDLSKGKMNIKSETKDGISEGIIVYSEYDLNQLNTRFIIITPDVYDGNVKFHSEYENVSVNAKNIIYLNSSNINNLNVKISTNRYIYDGKAKTPAVTIKGLIKDVDYKVTYLNNINAGVATVNVSGCGMFSGNVTLKFSIEKKADTKKPEITKVATKPSTVVKKEDTTKKTQDKKKFKKDKKIKVYKAGFKFRDKTFTYKVKKDGSSKKIGEVKIVGLRKKNIDSVYIKGIAKYKKVKFNITEIDDKAFNKIKKLNKITIGKNVKLIGKSACSNCKKLDVVIIKSEGIIKIGKDAFADLKKEFKIRIPKSRNKKYRKLLKKSGYKGIIK